MLTRIVDERLYDIRMTDRCWAATAYIYDMDGYDGNAL